MRTRSIRSAAIALLLPLAGCVNMSGLSGESKYACAAPEGVACDSVSGTYANAMHNNLPSQRGRSSPSNPDAEQSQPHTAAATPTAASAPARKPVAGALPSIAQPGLDGQPSMALRSQARVLRLWTKPWEDTDGDLWDQGYVYVQVDAGRWQIDHVRQRIRDQYVPLRPPLTPSSGAAGGTPSQTSGAEPESPDAAATTVQRPSPFSSFPSLTRPPAGLGSRTP